MLKLFSKYLVSKKLRLNAVRTFSAQPKLRESTFPQLEKFRHRLEEWPGFVIGADEEMEAVLNEHEQKGKPFPNSVREFNEALTRWRMEKTGELSRQGLWSSEDMLDGFNEKK